MEGKEMEKLEVKYCEPSECRQCYEIAISSDTGKRIKAYEAAHPTVAQTLEQALKPQN